jgi:hypothetical protein
LGLSNNQVDPQAVRGLGGSKGTDAHIYADDEANPRRCGPLDDIVAQIVAFANAVGNVKVGAAAAEFDGGLQNDDCHRAIDVVVAVDENGLFAFDGRCHALYRDAQAAHLLGRVQVGQRWRQKTQGRI